jgi:GT2 family glycosyltransferase
VSSRRSHQSQAGKIPLCRIGERVFLSPADAESELLLRVGALASRELDIAAGDRDFRVYQFATAPDSDEFQALPSLGVLAADIGLVPAEWAALVRSLLGTAVRMLRLDGDPVLTALVLSIMETPGLPTAKVGFDIIEGHDTAVATIPSRAGFAEGDVLVSMPGDRLAVGRVEMVHRFLGRDDGRQRLAALFFSGVPGDGNCLLAGAAGLVRVEAQVRRHANAEAFHIDHARTNPDLVSLYSQADEDAATILDRLARQGPATSMIREPFLSLQFVLDTAIPLANGLFASGWFHDPEGRIANVVAVDHGIDATDISARWTVFEGKAELFGKLRPVKRFVAFLPGERAVATMRPVPVRVQLSNGESHLVNAEPAPHDLLSQRERILEAIALHAFSTEMLENVFAPSLAPIHAALNARQSVRNVKQFGRPSAKSVSLVIPLYKETGFIRSQLMAFAVDPYVRDHCEIVYVLDDPLIDLTVASLVEGLAMSYPLDLKLVTLDRNGGYALANNMGAGEAEGEVLVLMNSDVIPDRAGWIEMALGRLARLPPFSVIGPKLIYADDSLQHAGMYFYRLPNGYWQNFHYWKGYGRHFAAAERERIVPAVTGACMIIRKADYLAVGGFTADYIIGDYEDSDLCLKLRERNGVPLYMPSLELYHFERQSMPLDDDDRDLGSTTYNRVLHSARWSDQITALMSATGEAANVL